MVVIQPHGRHGPYNPHRPIISTSGGGDPEGQQWVHVGYVPYPMLHKKWQWYALERCRETVKTDAINTWIDTCYQRYPNGCVAQVPQGDVPARSQSWAMEVAKDVVRPPLSVRRIDRYDGQQVPYQYRSQQTERVERERVDVSTLIGRMMQHVFPKGFKRIRSYGVQAAKTFAKSKSLMHEALAQGKGIVKGAIKILAAKT